MTDELLATLKDNPLTNDDVSKIVAKIKYNYQQGELL